jgi:hypothetical protein
LKSPEAVITAIILSSENIFTLRANRSVVWIGVLIKILAGAVYIPLAASRVG